MARSSLRSLGNRLRSSPFWRALYTRLPTGAKGFYRLLARGPARLAWHLHPDGKRHATRLLQPLHGRYRGRRAIVMGNGPSLLGTDWRLLSGEFTIGTNRIYLMREEMGFSPSVFVCANDLVLRQFHQEIGIVESLKFIDWSCGHKLLPADESTLFLPEIATWRFYENLFAGWNVGYTVTFAALQVAFHLGFDEVILIGVDHRFSASGPAMREVVANGPDVDHFSSSYFGSGTRWDLPNLEGSERSYRLARAAYEAAGRRIVDATDGGALRIFPRKALEAALGSSPALAAGVDPRHG